MRRMNKFQYMLMFQPCELLLCIENGMSKSDVSRKSLIGYDITSKTTKKFVEWGLISLGRTNARTYNISLTEKGESIKEKMRSIFLELGESV